MFKGVTTHFHGFMSLNVERKAFLLGCIWSSFPADCWCACVCVCKWKRQPCSMHLLLEGSDGGLHLNNLQHIRYFYVLYFVGFIFCLFRRGTKLAGYGRHNKNSTCTFRGIVEGTGTLV